MKTNFLTKLLMSLWVAIALFFVVPGKIVAQELELEKSFAFPEENKDRALLNVDYDAQNKTFTMFYVTKVSPKIVKFETYVFDYDFTLISQEKNEYEPEKARSLFSWFKYRGEEFVTDGIGVDESDDIVLRKLEITSKYKWLFNKYKITSKTLDKVKLRNDDGSKYFHWKNFIDDTEGSAYVLAGVKSKKDKQNHFKDMHILKINKDIDVVKDVALTYNEPRFVEYTKADLDDEDNFLGWVLIFRCSEEEKKGKSSPKYNYVYLDKDLNVVDNIQFEGPAGGLILENSFISKTDNSAYFHGISEKGVFSLLKISNHKVVYAINATPDQLEEKFQRPPSQKGGKPFKGEKFEISDQFSNDKGEFFICGQNWDKGGALNTLGALQGQRKSIRYTDCCLFHFDNQGKIIGQYSYDTKWFNNEDPCDQFIYQGSGGNKNYWVVIPQAYLPWPNDYFMYYPLNIAPVDVQSGKIGDFLKIDNKKISEIKDLYLDWNFPLIETEKGKLVLIGKDRPKSSGKNIWMGRLRLE